MESVHYRVAKLLNEAAYTNDLREFTHHFLQTLDNMSNHLWEIVFLLNNESRQVYLPIGSTNRDILNDQEDYKIDVSTLEQLSKTIHDKGFSVLKKQNVKGHDLFHNQKQFDDFIIIPLFYESEKIGLLMFLRQSGKSQLKSLPEVQELANALSPWIKRLMENEHMLVERRRKELLLKVTRKFHSSMDVNAILEEILEALYEAYPTLQVDLLLSHDWKVSNHLPVKPLDFQSYTVNDLAAQAYLTGKLQAEDIIKERRTILFVPLKGKQGVYGVFKMTASNTLFFAGRELEFIQVLADTAGNAIENAELYQQSQQHIANLKLINQTSQQLNETLKLSDVIRFLVNRMRENLLVDEVGFLMFDHHWAGTDHTLTGSSSYFYTDNAITELELIINKIKQQKEGIFLGNCENESIFCSTKFKTIMAVPMINNNKVIGVVIGLGKEAYSFSFDTFKLFRSLVQHSTLVFVNAMLHEELAYLVITDYLTKLYTREYLDEQITLSLNKDQFGSFILIDIDHFKRINDQYGHQIGDEVIIQVANVIKEEIRTDKDLAARWGGEELAIYLPEMRKLEAIKVAEKIREKVKTSIDYNITVSCGVSYWSVQSGNRSLKTLFNLADKAMYCAKEQGRNQVVYD